MALFEPADQTPNFNVFTQQWLARQKNTADLLQLVGDNSGLEGNFETLEDVVAALVVAVGKLNTAVNTTAETSDYSLSVGETAQIDITTASTPLNIAVEDGVYEITILFDPTTFAVDSSFVLNTNNVTHAGEFTRVSLRGDTTIATDEVDASVLAVDGHLDHSINGQYIQVTATIIIMGSISSATCISFYMPQATGVPRIATVSTLWTAAAHTSLGTLVVSEAVTGVVYVKRTA